MEVLAWVFLPHAGQPREAPEAGEIFRQPNLAATLRKLVEAEQTALGAGRSRKDAIQAAYDRFYKGDVTQELVRGMRGGLFTADDLANWRVKIEEPFATNYKGPPPLLKRFAPNCRRWATRGSLPIARRGRSPRSGSTGDTARCGAPRAITARTMASRGSNDRKDGY